MKMKYDYNPECNQCYCSQCIAELTLINAEFLRGSADSSAYLSEKKDGNQ